MNELSVSKFLSGMHTSPIGQRTILPKGENYLFEKTNSNYNIIVEIDTGVWSSAKETDKGFVYTYNNKPVNPDARFVMLNTGFERTTNKMLDVSIKPEFKTVPVKSVLRMKIANDKGYASLDLKPLTTKELETLSTVL